MALPSSFATPARRISTPWIYSSPDSPSRPSPASSLGVRSPLDVLCPAHPRSAPRTSTLAPAAAAPSPNVSQVSPPPHTPSPDTRSHRGIQYRAKYKCADDSVGKWFSLLAQIAACEPHQQKTPGSRSCVASVSPLLVSLLAKFTLASPKSRIFA